MLNRDTKATRDRYQTKEIIIAQDLKDFPLLLAATEHFDKICEVGNYKL